MMCARHWRLLPLIVCILQLAERTFTQTEPEKERERSNLNIDWRVKPFYTPLLVCIQRAAEYAAVALAVRLL
jgi:hypothetical protein